MVPVPEQGPISLMSFTTTLTLGPAVAVPLIILSVVSTLGNLYQAGFLSPVLYQSGVGNEPSKGRKLSFSPSNIEDHVAQLELTMIPALGNDSPYAAPLSPFNTSSYNASDVAGPGHKSLPEQPSPRALSSDSSDTSSTDHSSHQGCTEDSSDKSHTEHSSDKSSTEHSSDTSSTKDSSDTRHTEHSDSGSDDGARHGSSHASSVAGGMVVVCEEYDGVHFHQDVALFVLFNFLLLGTLLLHINAYIPKLQFTLMLFICGIIISLFLEGLELKCNSNILTKSYVMWMDIDPHLLLRAMLPALLAGDAMTIDTAVAKRVSLQCLYLAGPGVVVSAMLIALFLQYYLSWSFLLSLTTSSILCATDPVAVVALLKELGASPVLTVQIQGESLLNDGTAIVLYTVAYEMLSGIEYDAAKIAMFLVKTALMACAVGCFLGYGFFSWLRFANDRFQHATSVIQVLLTLCCAYWSFLMAEGVFKMSGVLATVCSSLVLAHHMWPHLVNKDALQGFWHVLEEMFNIIIFLLGGSLCGAAMVNIEPIDYVHLLVIYLILTIARGSLIFGSIPLLKFLNMDKMPVSKADAAVMTWGGLRGAVGLALAIQVRRGMAPHAETEIPQISENDAQRVLFFVSGIAFLTTVVNAATCPFLVNALGITALPHAQEKLLLKFNSTLVKRSHEHEHPKDVTESLDKMFEEIRHEIHEKAETGKAMSTKIREKFLEKEETARGVNGVSVCNAFRAAQAVLSKIPERRCKRLDHPAWSFDDLGADAQAMLDLVGPGCPDEEMSKVVVRVFITMVRHNYTQQIEEGELRPGSAEAEMLFASVRHCLSPLTMNLRDFDFLNHSIAIEAKHAEEIVSVAEEDLVPDEWKEDYHAHGKCKHLPKLSLPSFCHQHEGGHVNMASAAMHKHFKHISDDLSGCQRVVDWIVRSPAFAYSCIAAIMLNGVVVVADELLRDENDDSQIAWLIVDWVFTVFFLAEAVLKIGHSHSAYFKDVWNIFDFFLVVVGITGAILSTIEYTDTSAQSHALSEAASASRVIRIAKVLRSMRLLRVFLIFHALLNRDRKVSDRLHVNMMKVQTLSSFVQGHIAAQKQMKKFYLGNDFDDVDICRCLLQSMTSVHKALVLIISVQRKMKASLLDELLHVKEAKRITESLEHFVEEAESLGALSPQEAHSILHPMHHELAQCLHFIDKLDDGVLTKGLTQDFTFQTQVSAGAQSFCTQISAGGQSFQTQPSPGGDAFQTQISAGAFSLQSVEETPKEPEVPQPTHQPSLKEMVHPVVDLDTQEINVTFVDLDARMAMIEEEEEEAAEKVEFALSKDSDQALAIQEPQFNSATVADI